MKNRGTQNEWLDEVGRALLEAAKVRNDEIENIVASPHLFQSVKARIEGQMSESSFRIGGPLQRWNWRLSFAACGMLVIFFAGAIGLNLYSKKTPPVVKAPAHNTPDLIATPDTGDFNFPPEEIDHFAPRNTSMAQKTVYKSRSRMPERPLVKVDEVTDFYPLTGATFEGNDDGGQLVRVELPRSTLIAMGVDPPSENNGSRVKTDLLIGSDGVMKAVRFVK
ncbi:MAG: hypothetical protein ACRD43_09130 [Pyrinomonadaceae bacterium]